MKKIFKQSFSLLLALMMVLSLVPAQSLVANAANGYQWTYTTGNEWLTGAFNTADTDGIYEVGQAYDWYATLSPTKTGATVNITGTIVDDATGATISSVSKSVDVAKSPAITPIISYQDFPELTEDLAGTFTLTCVVAVGSKNYAQLQARFTREAPAPSVAYGATWQYLTGYEWVSGNVSTADEDYIYEAGQAYDWAVTVSPTSTGATVIVNATITNKAGEVISTVTDKSVDCGKAPAVTTLLTAADFPELTGELIGDFKLEATVAIGTKSYAGVDYIFGRTGAYVEEVPEETVPEETVPEETTPEEPVVPTKPGEVAWTYANSAENESYSWMNGAVKTENNTGIFKGWDHYDWAVTLSPTKTAATITVEAEVIDHTGAPVGTVTKDVEVGKAPAVTTILTPADLGLNNKTLGDFRVTAVIKYTNPETQAVTSMAQVQFVFGRRIGDVGYTATEYLKTYEWINAAFNAVDEDKSYVGEQPYDWTVSIAPSKSAAVVDVAATVVDSQGNTVATLTKTGVECAKTAATTILSASELTELTTDLYGQFALTCVVSMSGKQYAGIYGVFERVEGEWVAPNDPTNPVFTPSAWEACGLPQAIEVHNPGEMAKRISVEIDLNGNKLTKTVDVAVGGSAELVTTNQLRNVIKERGATYTVTITGYWKNAYQQVDINETLTYVWADHTDTEVVPGYAATCTEPGLTDGLFCNGCQGTVTEQEEIAIDPEAHNFVDGTCACGATENLTDSSLIFYRAKPTNPYGNFKLTGEIIAYLTARKQATYDDYYVVFSYTYLDNVVTFEAVPSAQSDANYALFDCPVPAALMTTGIEATVYGVKGDKAYRGETITFTVRECVDAKLDMWINNYGKNAQVTNLFDTLVNMLEYGAQAQTRFGINTENLATDGLPENYAAKIKTDVLTLNKHSNPDETGKNATLYSMNLMLKEKINMYGNFKVKSGFTKIEDYKVEIVHIKADGSTVTHEITNVELKTGNYVYFEFDKVAPAQMRDELQITLYQNGEAVSATYVRSGETIVASFAAALQPLGNAAMQFADCAKAAFG